MKKEGLRSSPGIYYRWYTLHKTKTSVLLRVSYLDRARSNKNEPTKEKAGLISQVSFFCVFLKAWRHFAFRTTELSLRHPLTFLKSKSELAAQEGVY
jgi:hypothetical protein